MSLKHELPEITILLYPLWTMLTSVYSKKMYAVALIKNHKTQQRNCVSDVTFLDCRKNGRWYSSLCYIFQLCSKIAFCICRKANLQFIYCVHFYIPSLERLARTIEARKYYWYVSSFPANNIQFSSKYD